MTCPKCGQPIKPGQLYLPEKGLHVACPSEREIAHDEWLRRARYFVEEARR
jgi:hypothetical protein